MAAGRSAAEPGRLLAGRAGHLPTAAVLAGSRHAGEDLLAVAGPAKAAKWPVPERPIPPAGGQRAGARQAPPRAAGTREFRLECERWHAHRTRTRCGRILTPGAGDEPGRCGPGRSPVPLHLPRGLLAVALVPALILPEPGGQLRETRCATASSRRG
jgi:hypothetical protein